MAKKTFLLSVLIATVLLVVSCATPTPQTVTIEKTVEIVTTQLVEVQVEKTTVVEVTPIPTEKKIVEFASFWPKDSPNGREMMALGYRLEAENPECDFVFSEFPGAEAYKVVSLRAQEGDPVDVFSGGANAVIGGGPEWEAGLLYDLAADMAQPAYGKTEGTWYDTFNAGAQAEMKFDDHVGMVPANQVVLAMFYNQAMYEEYSLTPPTTWEQFMANCEVLKGKGVKCIGGGGFNGYVAYWYDHLLFRLMGNDRMKTLYNNTDPNIKWTDEEPIKAGQMLVDMIKNGYAIDGFAGGDFAANQVAFFTGKVGHLYIGTFVMGEVIDVMPKDFRFGVTYFPTIEGYEDKTPYESLAGYVNSFGIYNPGQSSKEQHSTECAVEYLKLYSDAEVQAGLVKSLGFISAVKGVPGPENIPGVGELTSNLKLQWPTTQGIHFTLPPEIRTKFWDNVVLLAQQQITPQEFGELMEKDYATLP